MGAYITIPWGAGASRGGPKGRFCELTLNQFQNTFPEGTKIFKIILIVALPKLGSKSLSMT